jgi:hypothetical protein
LGEPHTCLMVSLKPATCTYRHIVEETGAAVKLATKILKQGALAKESDERQRTRRSMYPRSVKILLDDAGETVNGAARLRRERDLEQKFVCICVFKDALSYLVNLLARRQLEGQPGETVDIP